MIKPIDWTAFPEGEWAKWISQWDEADKELATLAVRVYQNLEKRLEKQQAVSAGPYVTVDPFVKIPGIADGLSQSLWYADETLVQHVRELVVRALIIATDRRLKEFVE